MAKTLTKKPAATAAAPKLNKPKTAAKGKVTKAPKGKAKSTEPKLNIKPGQEAEFIGYAEKNDKPVFQPGDRITIVDVQRNEEGQQVFSAVKAEDYAAYQNDPEEVNGDQLFAPELKKAEKLPVDPYAMTLQEDATLEEYISEHGDDPLQAGVAAVEDAAKATFIVGGCLAKLYAGQKFRDYGDYADTVEGDRTILQSGWDRFCQEHFGMGGRKAHSMVLIYRSYNSLGDAIDLEAVATNKKIGWVKLAAAAPVISKGNAAELIERMENENVNEFKETIKTDYVAEAGAGGETRNSTSKVKRTTLKVVFFEDAGVAVQEVINAVKKELGTEDLGTTLEYIIMTYAADNLSDTTQKKVRGARKSKLNELKKQGVDITDRQEALTNLEARIAEARGEAAAEEQAEA